MSLCATSALKIAQKLAAASIVSDSELTDHEIDKEPQNSLDDLVARINEKMGHGKGEIVIDVGVDDEGNSLHFSRPELDNYIRQLTKAANILGADLSVIHYRQQLKTNVHSEENFHYAHVLIRKIAIEPYDILEQRIAVVGNVDAGKSTLLGVLTKDLLDDGRGKARINLFKHQHEIDSGRTSSVGMEIMGFNSKGQIVTSSLLGRQKLTWEEICDHSAKVLTFVDLAGHEKYLKTTVFGMTGCSPDFVMLMIASNNGIIGMTKEHLGLALALQVPVFIVVTKIDMCPPNVLQETLSQITKILKSSGCRKIPMFINSMEDVLVTSENFVSERICPIFQVSNVTGQNLDLLKTFLNILQTYGSEKYDANKPVEFQITDDFSVPGVGTVVSGVMMSGTVHAGDTLMLGPDPNGQFVSTVVKSIQRKRVNVPTTTAGQNASFALKKIKRAQIRKGMIMLSKNSDAFAVYEFEAEVLILYHSTTISPRYQAMLHCGCVRQTAKIVSIDKQLLRTGDRAIVRFRFLRHPEFLKPGTRLLFREGRTKGIGKVSRLIRIEETLQKDQEAALLAPPPLPKSKHQ